MTPAAVRLPGYHGIQMSSTEITVITQTIMIMIMIIIITTVIKQTLKVQTESKR